MKLRAILSTTGKILLTIELIIVGGIVLFLAKSCLGLYYSEMTHLSEEDLAWAECVTRYPNPRFVSDAGDTAVLEYENLVINNQKSPFYIKVHYLETEPPKLYVANLYYSYHIINSQDSLNGFLEISTRYYDSKEEKFYTDSLSANANLYDSNLSKSIYGINGYDYRRPAVQEIVKIGNELYTDCLVFDSINAYYRGRGIYYKNNIWQFIISKKYGLISYRYKDGRHYSQIPDEN